MSESKAGSGEAAAEIRGGCLGVSFRRQLPLGNYIADFAAPAAKLVVEVDGAYHSRRQSADARRDCNLGRLGYRVLRLEASLVEKHLEEAGEREFQNDEVQAHREAIEFDAWSQINEAEDAQRSLEQAREGMRSQLDQIRGQLQELQDAERKRRHEASLAALVHHGERRGGIEFELADALTMVAPVAAVLAIAYLAREPAKGA